MSGKQTASRSRRRPPSESAPPDLSAPEIGSRGACIPPLLAPRQTPDHSILAGTVWQFVRSENHRVAVAAVYSQVDGCLDCLIELSPSQLLAYAQCGIPGPESLESSALDERQVSLAVLGSPAFSYASASSVEARFLLASPVSAPSLPRSRLTSVSPCSLSLLSITERMLLPTWLGR